MVAFGMLSGPLADILLPTTPTLGDAKAPVIIVEFSDFTCGYCGKFYRESLPKLKGLYIFSGRVRFAYRDWPRDDKGWGPVSAHAARCAGEQGKYWEMHDRLFEEATRLGSGVVMRAAKDLDLKVNAFSACMDSLRHLKGIMADRDAGSKLGFRGTPGFILARTDGRSFTDGVTIPGAVPFPTFRDTIERLLKKG
jgi:protein-disulfide isomerase